jgi:hypothetical protein
VKKADKATAQRRVDELLAILLNGGQGWSVFQYVRKKEKERRSIWYVGEDENPLSDHMIRKYLTRAYELMESSFEKSRRTLVRRHIGKLNHLHNRAMKEGELAVARATLRDLAEMQQLLPRPEEALLREVAALKRQLENLEHGDGSPQSPDRTVAVTSRSPQESPLVPGGRPGQSA